MLLRRRSLVAAAIYLLPWALRAQAPLAPALTPQPRELHLPTHGVSSFAVRSASIMVPGADAEDLFAAGDLGRALEATDVHVAQGAGTADLSVTLLRAGDPAGRALAVQEKLAWEPAMHDEGYLLIAHPGQVTIIADTSAGIFYGVQTLKQLVERLPGGPVLWLASIRDWPAMRHRGMHDDLSRGPFPTLGFQKHQLDVFAAHKVNLYSPYFEHTLQYSADPLAAPPGSSLTRAEAQELEAYARARHILIVPEQEAFGHLHHVLKYEKYAALAETPHGHVIAPGQAGSQPIIKSWFTQIDQDFPSPFLHVGADETFELGTGRTRAEVEKRGLGPVYADFLTTIHETLAPLHRRLLFWGDVAETSPAAIDRLPKDMIAIPWIYWHKDSYDTDILPFKKAGIETWVAPGDANWNVVSPLGNVALDNISGFVEAGQRLGSTGELTVAWNDDGEGLFNQDWFGMLFGAAAGWQPGRSNGAAYQATFGRSFFGDTTGRIDEAERELLAATDLMDGSDRQFWLDPWGKEAQSQTGLAAAAKMRPKVSAGRLHAERAIELIETARATDWNLREREALAAMELGARRIDFIGMKLQFSDEIASAYARAYVLKDDPKRSSEAADILYSISSMNGRCQDLRDGYSMIKNLYRESWLAENRPYWLDNVLVRYDLEIERWQRRGSEVSALINDWEATKHLPAAAEAGLPGPIGTK